MIDIGEGDGTARRGRQAMVLSMVQLMTKLFMLVHSRRAVAA
jgi:hypothetical protein